MVVKGQSSTWRPVSSGIPQGSVMGPVLFVLYINDLPDSLKHDSEVYLYADDTKVFHKIKTENDCKILQKDIEQIQKWADTWMLTFHPDKCKRMRIGKSNVPEFQYKLKPNLKPMEKSEEEEKDIGVIVDENPTFESHMNEKINKANKVLGAIRGTFQYLDNDTFKLLYTSMVRSLLEYCNPVWSPYKIKHIDMLENLQRRATRLLPGMDNLNYAERLAKLNLPSLTYRRHRGDLIEAYKIITHKYDPEVCDMFELREYGITRGHTKKIYKERSRLQIRQNSFKNRIVDIWNTLPQKVVDCKTVLSFERNLDKYWKDQDNKFYHRTNISTNTAPKQYTTVEENEELTSKDQADLLSEQDF